MRYFVIFCIAFFLNDANAQTGWSFYNGIDDLMKESGGLSVSFQENPRLRHDIHIKSENKIIGSVCLIREQQSKYKDKILMMPDDFMLFNYLTDDSLVHWVLIKVYASSWISLIRSIVPSDTKTPITTKSKIIKLNESETQALNLLTDKVKTIYCKVRSNNLAEKAFAKSSLQGESYDELKKQALENEIQQMEKARQERINEELPSSVREVVYQNKIYLVNPYDGFVYFEVNYKLPDDNILELKTKIINSDGVDIFNRQSDIRKCTRIVSGANDDVIADLKLPNVNIILPENLKKKYGIKKIDEFKDNVSNKNIQGLSLTTASLISSTLHSCPPELAYNTNFPGIENVDANTYLIDDGTNTNLNNWYLFTGPKCNKCEESVGSGYVSEIYSSKQNQKIKILKTSNFKILTTSEYSEEKANIIQNLKSSFSLSSKGKIENNIVEYLGEGGLVYERTRGGKAITNNNVTLTYSGKPINTDTLNTWLSYFDRGNRKIISTVSVEIVNSLFESAASGKINWFKNYRQNPLAFLSKYCNRPIKE